MDNQKKGSQGISIKEIAEMVVVLSGGASGEWEGGKKEQRDDSFNKAADMVANKLATILSIPLTSLHSPMFTHKADDMAHMISDSTNNGKWLYRPKDKVASCDRTILDETFNKASPGIIEKAKTCLLQPFVQEKSGNPTLTTEKKPASKASLTDEILAKSLAQHGNPDPKHFIQTKHILAKYGKEHQLSTTNPEKREQEIRALSQALTTGKAPEGSHILKHLHKCFNEELRLSTSPDKSH